MTTKTSNNGAQETFASGTSKSQKRRQGRTDTATTPLHLRSSQGPVDPQVKALVQDRTTRELAKFATHIERISIRFEDVNGPRGGVGIECRIKVVLSGLPSVLAQGRGRSSRAAFNDAVPGLKSGIRTSLGRASRNLASRDERGVTEAAESARTARSARGGQRRAASKESTARRNVKTRRKGMTAVLEDSATGTPSRKSTRKAVNRAKSATGLERRQQRRVSSPKARAARAAARS